MKATELMIGDWVSINGKQVWVWTLTQHGIVGYKDGDHSYYGSEDDVEPILLTAEILEKNFPDRRHCVYWYWHDKISTDTENWYELHIEVGTDEGVVRNIRYVHELQHALKLCGIEKEIEL